MPEKFEVSFNSPQCGWMSVGFRAGDNEFHTTTAHAPHEQALSNLLLTLTAALGEKDFKATLPWNRDPEAFDFLFEKRGSELTVTIVEYPTEARENGEIVFHFSGRVVEIVSAFYKTFQQLFLEREADEFAENWRQPFPIEEYKNFENLIGTYL